MTFKKTVLFSIFSLITCISMNQSLFGSFAFGPFDDSEKIVDLKQEFNRICNGNLNKLDKKNRLKELFIRTENEFIVLDVKYVPRLFLQGATILVSTPILGITSMNFIKDPSIGSAIELSLSMLPILVSLSFYVTKKYKLSELNNLKNKIQLELGKEA